jgi:hypothetical protein
MSKPVIHAFEVVYVAAKNRERALIASALLELA